MDDVPAPRRVREVRRSYLLLWRMRRAWFVLFQAEVALSRSEHYVLIELIQFTNP